MWSVPTNCSLPTLVSRLHSMQAALFVVQHHHEHVSMDAVVSVDPPLERTGSRHGSFNDLDARKRRFQRLMNFDPHSALLQNRCCHHVVQTILRDVKVGDILQWPVRACEGRHDLLDCDGCEDIEKSNMRILPREFQSQVLIQRPDDATAERDQIEIPGIELIGGVLGIDCA